MAAADIHPPYTISTLPSADMPPHTSCSNWGDVEIHTPRSLSLSHPLSSQRCSMRRRSSAARSAMVSLDDYERLPASIKRKFFSSTERLSIAHQSSVNHRRRKLSIGQGSFKLPTNNDQSRPTTAGPSSRRQSRRESTDFSPAITDITQEQAHWYLSLPDKIRKQQFTRREQITFALQCQRALENNTPNYAQDAFYRGLTLDRKEENKNRRPSAATVNTDILVEDVTLTALRSDSLLDDVNPVDQYPSPVLRASKSMVDVSTPSTPPPLRRKSNSISMKRKSYNHLRPLPLPPPQLAPAPPMPLLPRPSGTLRQRVATPAQPVQPSETSTTTERRTESGHQPQSDLRKQLRQWLTPEKFDEALEFGFAFPSTEIAPPALSLSGSNPQQPPPLCHTDDEYSEADGSDSIENAGPITPTTVPEYLFPTAKKPSFDSTADLSSRSSPFSTWNRSRKHGPVDTLAEREMTVRVTLTRRDLREPVYPGKGVDSVPTPKVVDVARVDPLALEALPICEDPTGAHGAFAVTTTSGPKGLKKMWRALRRH